MEFRVGEEVELIDSTGFVVGKYTIDEINWDIGRVWFTHSMCGSGRGRDRIHNLRKIVHPGEQLEFDW